MSPSLRHIIQGPGAGSGRRESWGVLRWSSKAEKDESRNIIEQCIHSIQYLFTSSFQYVFKLFANNGPSRDPGTGCWQWKERKLRGSSMELEGRERWEPELDLFDSKKLLGQYNWIIYPFNSILIHIFLSICIQAVCEQESWGVLRWSSKAEKDESRSSICLCHVMGHCSQTPWIMCLRLVSISLQRS
jgi:hypothetical protein